MRRKTERSHVFAKLCSTRLLGGVRKYIDEKEDDLFVIFRVCAHTFQEFFFIWNISKGTLNKKTIIRTSRKSKLKCLFLEMLR